MAREQLQQSGNCVEVRAPQAIRDSKDPGWRMLRFSPTACGPRSPLACATVSSTGSSVVKINALRVSQRGEPR